MVFAMGIPLLASTAMLAAMSHTIPAFDAMFKEMDLGQMPLLTRLLLLPNQYGLYHPIVAVSGLIGIWSLYLLWAQKKHSRIVWFASTVFGLSVAFVTLAAIGLLGPMQAIMERIGK